MKYLIVLVTLFFNLQAIAEPYKTAQRFEAGDVLSADVVNDILDRIELSLKDVTVSELVGTWDATQYFCDASINDPSIAVDAESWSCAGTGGIFQGVSSPDGGYYAKRTDTVTIAAVDGSSTKFTFSSPNYNMIYNDSKGKEAGLFNLSSTHICTIVGGIAMMGCQLDDAWTEGARKAGAYLNIQRLSPTRIKLFFGPWRGGGLFNTVILDKKNLVPDTPTSLSVTQTSGATNSVTLTWTEGDATEINYDVKRKDSAEGTYTSIGTPTAETYVDATATARKTYWYRVFAINTNGTSLGSNVVNIAL